jgi:hypothetical protein
VRLALIAAIAMLMAIPAVPQGTSSGSIFGLVSDRLAHLVASAPIEAKNLNTGDKYQVVSGPTGEYRISALPKGDYELTVKINTAGDFVQRHVTVDLAEPVRFDIILPLP